MATVAPSRAPMGTGASTASESASTSHPYTCNTCQVAFRSGDLQRKHMHSDWHRYNLKRRVASLPPLSSEVFADKVLTAQASTTEAAAKASYEKSCLACHKTYYSENAYENHLKSQKHKAQLAASQRGLIRRESGIESVVSSTFSLGTPSQSVVLDDESDLELSGVIEGVKGTVLTDVDQHVREKETAVGSNSEAASEKPLDPTICLFCNYKSPSLALSVLHMEKIHGMFIPERNYLVDLEGLIKFLHNKIYEFHECLYCGKIKGTIPGIQTHMRDKGHCMIAFESEAEMIEVGQYYDFSSTYSDSESDDEDDGNLGDGVKLGAKRKGTSSRSTRRSNGDKGDDDEIADAEGWETDSSASSLASAELTAVPIDHRHAYEKLRKHPHHSHHDPRPHHNTDGWHSHAHAHPHAVYYDEYEMHLPSGRSVGHRSLARYYRQNLHSRPSLSERQQLQEQRALADANSSGSGDEDADADAENSSGRGRVVRRDRRTQGLVGISAAKRHELSTTEARERKRENRARLRYQWGLDKRGNSQKHFRDPLLQ